MSAESALIQLIQSPEARAIALVGSWGRGKTHLWRRVVAETENQARAKHSYVSLFGINSLEDLKLAIFQKEIAAGPPAKEDGFWKRARKRLPWRDLAEGATQIENPWVGNLNHLYRAITFSRVQNRLICFDDFERKGRDLDIESVLGLISFLCEERACSVVLILNDGTIAEATEWNKYREKVFHGEVTYRPTTATCIDIILGPDTGDEWHSGVREILMQLDISNMRIMKRVLHAIQPLTLRYPHTSAETKRQLARTITIYSYCHNASGEGAPPVDYALKNPYQRIAASMGTDERSDDEKKWDATLSKIDFYPDELDPVVVSYIRDGYPDLEALDSQVDRLELAHSANSVDKRYSEAWASYHNSFDNNVDEVISKFRESFSAAAPTMHAMNANSSISLMRSLGQDDLADSFIEDWIASRRGERRSELSLSEAQIFGRLTDQAFIDAIVQAETEETTLPDFNAAMEIVSSGQGGLDRAMETISRAEVDAIVDWFKANAGRVSRGFTSTSMQMRGQEHIGQAQSLIRQALRKLAETSPINAARVNSILAAIGGG